MKTAVVIPARYASTRLPGKPLLRETGKYLVQHVYERACQAAGVDLVVVATDDPRIASAVAQLRRPRRDDAPRPSQRHRPRRRGRPPPRRRLRRQPPGRRAAHRAGLRRNAHPRPRRLPTPTWPRSPPRCNRPNSGATPTASRSSATPTAGPSTSAAAPSRSSATASPISALRPPRFLQHLGLYAYRRRFLFTLADLPPHPLEQLEKLEQLRVLAHGRAHPGRRRRPRHARRGHLRRLPALRRGLAAKPAGSGRMKAGVNDGRLDGPPARPPHRPGILNG